MNKLLREPLLHFTVVAILLFAADHAWNQFKDDRKTITVSALTQTEARETFKASMRREPSQADMKILINRWLDNEILYREGISLGLDKGDPAIRERVIFKALNVVQAGISLPAINDEELQLWFDKNRERYDVPKKFDFLEAVPTGGDQNIDLQDLASMLNSKSKSSIESSLRVFKQRPRANLLASYGEEFTVALEKSIPEQWVILSSQAGKHVVQLELIQAGVAADFSQFKIVALKDWREQTLSSLTTDSVRNMGKKFAIQQETDK